MSDLYNPNIIDGLSVPQVEGVIWTLTAVAIVLSIGRYVVRFSTLKKFQWDDLTHFIAMALMIACVGCFQVLLPYGYFITQLARKQQPMPSAEAYLSIWMTYRQYSLAAEFLLFTSLYIIKLSFLLFYWQIFRISRSFRIAWWIILVLVILTYWGTFGGLITLCGPVDQSFNFEQCNSPFYINYQNQVIEYTCALNVITDFAIMALPVYQIRTLKTGMRQKAGLVIIFALAIVTIIFDILRTVKSLQPTTTFSEFSCYYLAEATIAVMVSALPSYGTLIVRHRRKTSQYVGLNYNGTGPNGSGGGASKGRRTPASKVLMSKTYASNNGDADTYALNSVGKGSQSDERGEGGFNPDDRGIYVSRTFQTRSEPGREPRAF